MKIKGLLIALIFAMFMNGSIAQSKSANSNDYTTALGLKFSPGSVTLKHFIGDNKALEGLGYFWDRGVRITGLYEFHFDIAGAPGLKWYVGPGAHVGFYNTKFGGGSSIGVDGVLGLDYKFNSIPLNLSLDWQPSFEFGDSPQDGFGSNFGGLAVRYTF